MNANACLCLKYIKLISKEPIAALSQQCQVSYSGLGVQKGIETHLNFGLRHDWSQ